MHEGPGCKLRTGPFGDSLIRLARQAASALRSSRASKVSTSIG